MNNIPRFDIIPHHLGAELFCPVCETDVNLHHYKIEVWNRKSEDKIEGIHISIHDQQVNIDTETEHGNPSPRRDSIKISFWCETCSGLFALTLIQHKGTTYGEWRKLEGSAHEGLKT
jgi:hypothetical protein